MVENPCKAVDKPEAPEEDQDIRFLDQTDLDALLAATGVGRGRRKLQTLERAVRVRRLRDADEMPWKKIAATIGIAESTAIYLYRIEPDEAAIADDLGRVERVMYLTAAMTGMRQAERAGAPLDGRGLGRSPRARAAQLRARQVRHPKVQALVSQHPACRSGRA